MALLAKSLILLVWTTMVTEGNRTLSLFPPKTTVEIINMITSPPQRLTVHCKSKDNDIGEHKIGVREKFHFHFTPNVIPSTLFHCRFCWPCDTSVHHFDIYDQKRDVAGCVTVKHQGGATLCSWEIWKRGPCKYNRHSNAYTDCYPWSHPPTIATPSIVNASHVCH